MPSAARCPTTHARRPLYDLVPEVVARKLEARSSESVLFLHDRTKESIDEDDPYKDFKIPDD